MSCQQITAIRNNASRGCMRRRGRGVRIPLGIMPLGVMSWSGYSESPSSPQQYARSKDQDAAEDCEEPRAGIRLLSSSASSLILRLQGW